MKKLLVALALVAGACGGGGPKVGPEDVLAKMRSFKDKMCACKDKACVTGVEQELTAWATKHLGQVKMSSLSKTQEEQTTKLEEALRSCRDKAMTASPAEAPTAPPAK